MVMAQRTMAHNLIGKEVTATSAKDALHQAGLDWTVTVEELFTHDSIKLADRFATVKNNAVIDEDGVTIERDVLGVVGSRYHVLQNTEMFSALDMIVDSGEARYTAAGELEGGSQVWVMMELPSEVKIENDPHSAYLLARTSHDGLSSLQIIPIVQRLFCTNQINAAFGRAASKYTLRHTIGAKIGIQDVRDKLSLVYEGIKDYESVAMTLQAVTGLDEYDEKYLLKSVFPMERELEQTAYSELSRGDRAKKTRITAARAKVSEIFHGSTGTMPEWEGSAYGLYHAVVEYTDHFQGGSAMARNLRVVNGKADDFKNTALERILASVTR